MSEENIHYNQTVSAGARGKQSPLSGLGPTHQSVSGYVVEQSLLHTPLQVKKLLPREAK